MKFHDLNTSDGVSRSLRALAQLAPQHWQAVDRAPLLLAAADRIDALQGQINRWSEVIDDLEDRVQHLNDLLDSKSESP